jgi:hypothetical protein
MRRAQSRSTKRIHAKQLLGKDNVVGHHVVPESFFINRTRSGPAGWIEGDSTHPDNFAFLTHHEHTIAHLCLVRFINSKSGRIKMTLALSRMTKHKNISARMIAMIARIATTTNPFNKRVDGTSVQTDRVKDGSHHLLGGDIQRIVQQRIVTEGKHHNQNGEMARKQLLNGTHSSQIMIGCIYCKRVYTSAIFYRDHGDNCDIVNPRNSVVINGVTYNSRRLAAESLNIPEYQIKVIENGKKPRPTFTYDNVEYRSIAEATKATGLSWWLLTRSKKLGD